MEITNKVGKVRIVWKNIGPCFYGLFEHYTSTLIAVIYNFLVFAQTKQIHCLEETLFILWMQKCRNCIIVTPHRTDCHGLLIL